MQFGCRGVLILHMQRRSFLSVNVCFTSASRYVNLRDDKIYEIPMCECVFVSVCASVCQFCNIPVSITVFQAFCYNHIFFNSLYRDTNEEPQKIKLL